MVILLAINLTLNGRGDGAIIGSTYVSSETFFFLVGKK